MAFTRSGVRFPSPPSPRTVRAPRLKYELADAELVRRAVAVLNGSARSCGNSSVGRAQPCQGWGRGFESRFPLWNARTGERKLPRPCVRRPRRDGETGKRARLKILCPQGLPGSIPGPGMMAPATNTEPGVVHSDHPRLFPAWRLRDQNGISSVCSRRLSVLVGSDF